MSNRRSIAPCDICKQEKKCTKVGFIPINDKEGVKPKPYGGSVGTVFPGEFSMHCCEDCRRKHGYVQNKAWKAAILGHMLMIAVPFISALLSRGKMSNVYTPLISISMVVGWLMAIISGCILVMQNHQESSAGGLFLSLFAQFFPIFGLLALLARAKKLRRCARAISALKPFAEEKRRSEREADEALKQLLESGRALSEEEQAQLEEMKREKEAAELKEQQALKEQEKKTNTLNMRHAMLSILFTVVIGIYGANVYKSGEGHMQLFHSIDLSPEGFAALIGVLIVWDIIALVSAIKKKK